MLSAPFLSGEQTACRVALCAAPASIFSVPACENSCRSAYAQAANANAAAAPSKRICMVSTLPARILPTVRYRRAEFGDRPGHAAGRKRLLARSVALQGALEHTLCDRGKAEEAEREQEIPVRQRIEIRRGGKALDHRRFAR